MRGVRESYVLTHLTTPLVWGLLFPYGDPPCPDSESKCIWWADPSSLASCQV